MTIVREQVARETKWCPFSRAQNYAPADENPPVNRTVANFNCIASDCMAWRWWRVDSEIAANSVGYCGLAGAPDPSGAALDRWSPPS